MPAKLLAGTRQVGMICFEAVFHSVDVEKSLNSLKNRGYAREQLQESE